MIAKVMRRNTMHNEEWVWGADHHATHAESTLGEVAEGWVGRRVKMEDEEGAGTTKWDAANIIDHVYTNRAIKVSEVKREMSALKHEFTVKEMTSL